MAFLQTVHAPYAGILGAAVFALIVWRISKIGQRPKGYPPGPPTLPILGNIHQMPTTQPWLQFEQWAKEYGPIFSLMLGTKVWIVLTQDVAVQDLLVKRGSIYSSRPSMYLMQDIGSGGLRPLWMGHNESWRSVRRIAHRILNIKVARSYVPYQDLENKFMLQGLVDSPNDFINHIRRYATSLTTQMGFGYRTPTSDDPDLLELFHWFEVGSGLATNPIGALFDMFPIMKYLPDFVVPIKRTAKELFKGESAMFRKHYFRTREQLSSDTAKPCCSIDVLKAQKEEGFSDDMAYYILGSLLQAGSETTAAILLAFFLAMVLFPEVGKEAQAELDRVCGDRLPDLNDVPDLAYIRGCMKESLRWMPAAAMGVPHTLDKDDSYMGYHLPKGATVMINVWAIHRDSKRYTDPARYDPTRWAGDNLNSAESATLADPTKRDHFVFGAGRRMCQGMHIADRSLFLAMSRTLWAFNIGRAVDQKTGKELIPEEPYFEDGLFMCPKPFPAKITPRSPERVERIKQELDQAKTLLDENLQWKTVPEGLKWKDYDEEKSNIR